MAGVAAQRRWTSNEVRCSQGSIDLLCRGNDVEIARIVCILAQIPHNPSGLLNQ